MLLRSSYQTFILLRYRLRHSVITPAMARWQCGFNSAALEVTMPNLLLFTPCIYAFCKSWSWQVLSGSCFLHFALQLRLVTIHTYAKALTQKHKSAFLNTLEVRLQNLPQLPNLLTPTGFSCVSYQTFIIAHLGPKSYRNTEKNQPFQLLLYCSGFSGAASHSTALWPSLQLASFFILKTPLRQ